MVTIAALVIVIFGFASCNMDIGPFFLANINGILMTLLGWIYVKYPPKKINELYGYRTRRSMANQEIWNYANTIGAKMMLYLGVIMLFIGSVLYFFYPVPTVVMFSVFVMLIGLGVGMYCCETQLNKRFDKNGNPKKQPS